MAEHLYQISFVVMTPPDTTMLKFVVNLFVIKLHAQINIFNTYQDNITLIQKPVSWFAL